MHQSRFLARVLRVCQKWSWYTLAMTLCGCLHPWPVSAADLIIHLVGLRNANGYVRLSLYDRAESFLKAEGRRARQKAPAGLNPLTIRFPDLPPGSYAVTVHHDEDGDGKLNRNLLGLPREGYGFSNDARATFGPPGFDGAAVQLDTDNKVTTITVQY